MFIKTNVSPLSHKNLSSSFNTNSEWESVIFSGNFRTQVISVIYVLYKDDILNFKIDRHNQYWKNEETIVKEKTK